MIKLRWSWREEKMNIYMNKVLLIGALAFMVSSCYYDIGEELYPTDPNDCKTDSLTYDDDIKILINNSCAVSGCHVAGAQTPFLTTYAEVKANTSGIQQRAIVQGDMPPSGPLSACDKKKLEQWIADGAPESK